MRFLHGLWASQGIFSFRWDDPVTKKAILSLATLVVIYLLVLLVTKILNRAIKDVRWKYKTRKFLYYFGAFFFGIGLVLIWADFAGQFALVLSVIGAGVAIAFQQPLVSLVGWLRIIINRPYTIGDRIEINGIAGDVIDIQLLKTVLLEIGGTGTSRSAQSTGRVVDFANGFIFSQPLFNYTRGTEYLWNEYPILVTFESDWRRAHDVVLEIVNQHTARFESGARAQIAKMAEHYLIQFNVLRPIVYVAIRESGVELTLRYISPARQARQIRDAISRDILTAFQREPGVELAYPTTRSFTRINEEPKYLQKKAGREE